MAPVLDNIIAEIIDRLRNITRANGYAFNVAEVKQVERDTNNWQPQVLGIYIEQKEETPNEDLFRPGNPPAVAYNVQFEISGYARQLDANPLEAGVCDKSVSDNQMKASITKALANNDPSQWHQFGGNAINASLADGTPFDDPGFDGARRLLTVLYRVSETDPYIVRA